MAAMCAESHQYRPLLCQLGGYDKTVKTPILCPYCLLPACLTGACDTSKETPQACKCLWGFQLLQWALLDSNQRPPAVQAGGRQFDSAWLHLLWHNDLRDQLTLSGLAIFRYRYHIGTTIVLHRGGHNSLVRNVLSAGKATSIGRV